MALFKLRLPGRLGSNGPSADALSNTPAESVEVIRKRARHRLMGSVILVLGAVVGLPLLFDSQPPSAKTKPRKPVVHSGVVISRIRLMPLSPEIGRSPTPLTEDAPPMPNCSPEIRASGLICNWLRKPHSHPRPKPVIILMPPRKALQLALLMRVSSVR